MRLRPRRPGLVSALAVLGLLASACSGSMSSLVDKAGSDSQPSGGSAATSSAPPGVSHGAPPVQHPIDTTHFRKHPCDFLTPEQVETLTIPDSPKPDLKTQGFHSCSWEPHLTDNVSVAVGFLPNAHGLSSLYALNQQDPDSYDVFKPGAIVNGFPTVLALVSDGRSSGDCTYAVGLNNSDAVLVQLGMDTGGDPCHDALQVVKDVTLTAKREG
jgi:hypothetical protein